MRNKIKQFLILLGDIAMLYLSLFLALTIRYQTFPYSYWTGNLAPFSTIFVFWIIIFYIAGLYSLHTTTNSNAFFKSSLNATVISSAISILYFYANSGNDISPKLILLIFVLVYFIIFTTWRRLVNWLLGSFIPKNNVMFIGYNNQVEELIKHTKDRPNLGYHCAVIINKESTKEDSLGVSVIKDETNLKQVITNLRISTVVISKTPYSSDELRSELFSCLPLKVDIVSLPNFYEQLTGKVPIEAIGQIWFIENLSEGSKKWFDIGKRIFDITFSIIALILTFLFWPVIAGIIQLESKGGGFFRQKRAGENGRVFTMVKFRTMRTEKNDFSLTTTNDSRITKFGNFLRKTRIDELPQILNILQGDMSLVGPRPERPEFIEELKKEIPFYQERMLVKPGLTGWDQVSGEYHSPSKEDTLKKLQFDLFYIKNRSAYLDISIVLKTIAIVFSRKGV